MAIVQISIKNYRVFRDTTFVDMSPLSVVIGANGTGKSTLFDVFTFLKDALNSDVHSATVKRGGFSELKSRGMPGSIEIEVICFGSNDQTMLYSLHLVEEKGRTVISFESMIGRDEHELIVKFARGRGVAMKWSKDKSDGEEIHYDLDNPSTLAIRALGQIRDFPLVTEFRSLIENWYVSNFHINNARASAEAGYAEHLSTMGENVAQVARYLHENHSSQFRRVLETMRTRVPGVDAVEAKVTEDGRLVLRFKDGNFKDPFVARHVSDGTIKMFAYLLLLHDPKPHPLVAVEEPENQLYPTLLHELAEEFRAYAKRGGQALISTHSPEFLNGTDLSEVYLLRKVNGFAQVKRVGDSDLLRRLAEEGDLPGALWRQRLFDAPDL